MRTTALIAYSACLPVLFAPALPARASAQAGLFVDVPSTPSCGACRITVARVATLGSERDSVSPATMANGLSYDSQGRFYFTSGESPLILVYDRRGTLLKTLGRQGAGPGEYDFLVSTAVRGDSLLVYDQGQRRLTLLSPTHEVARTVGLRAGPFARVLPLGDTAFVASGTLRTPEHIGQTLFVVGRDGRVLRAFGADGSEVRLDQPQATTRRIGLTRSGDVISVRVDRYEIEMWRPGGTRLRGFRRIADWYPQWNDYVIRAPDVLKPKPTALATWEDSTGLIWILSRVAVRDWKPSKPMPTKGAGPVAPFSVSEANIDGVLEVLDPRTGRLVASQRFPTYFVGHAGGDLLYGFDETSDGDLRVSVWRASLIGYK